MDNVPLQQLYRNKDGQRPWGAWGPRRDGWSGLSVPLERSHRVAELYLVQGAQRGRTSMPFFEDTVDES